MNQNTQVLSEHFIGGQWVSAQGQAQVPLVRPSTGQSLGHANLGNAEDAHAAVRAAGAAAAAMAATTREQRQGFLANILQAYQARSGELARVIEDELGAPRTLCEQLHVPVGLMQLQKWGALLQDFAFTEARGQHQVRHQPVGVCVLISSWNYPVNGPMGVLLPAIVAGCPMVWKPSEYALRSGRILTEIFAQAGLPDGAFNMVMGGAEVGEALVSAREVAMVSFTGSAKVGQHVAQRAAASFKRTVLELGGKSPFVVLPGAPTAQAVQACAQGLFMNSGQSCNAPSRLLVPRADLDAAKAVAKAAAESVVMGAPDQAGVQMGPIGHAQHDRALQDFLEAGVREGSELIAGGPGRPAGLERGYYARPTVFVANAQAHVSQHEAFGPVMTIIPYDSVEDAIAIANDSEFGLSAYVIGPAAEEVAPRIQAGMVHVNGATMDLGMPFGGVKQSGIGRKFGPEGLSAYLEVQTVLLPAAQ